MPNPAANVPQPLVEELNCSLKLMYTNLPGVAAVLINAAFLNFLVADVEINNYEEV